MAAIMIDPIVIQLPMIPIHVPIVMAVIMQPKNNVIAIISQIAQKITNKHISNHPSFQKILN